VAIQVDSDGSSHPRIGKLDALLAHVWSFVVLARGLQEDPDPVHCDLVLEMRLALQLSSFFMHSPIMRLNIEMTASHVSPGAVLEATANCIRESLQTPTLRSK
jgi:hypothetical protein